MATASTIESPDFDLIEKESGRATRDAVKLLWSVANFESFRRRKMDRRLADRLSPKLLTLAPTASQNNFDTQGAGILYYNGTTSINITGYRAREDGDILFIHVGGTGTITHQHQNASSDATNRMVFAGAADKAVATNKSLILQYMDSRWREWSAA